MAIRHSKENIYREGFMLKEQILESALEGSKHRQKREVTLGISFHDFIKIQGIEEKPAKDNVKEWAVNKEEHQERIYFWQPNVENVARKRE